MKIYISESAFNDLEDIKEYYKEKGVPEVGEKFVISIIQHIEALSENPEIGIIVPKFNSPKLRELIHSPLRIVYTKEEKSIYVVRVWRSERLMKPLESPNGNVI